MRRAARLGMTPLMKKNYDAVALFSGGLDSILAIKTLEAQGLRVKCLHFVSSFFGKPEMLEHWSHVYGLDLECVDVSEDFARMLRERPAHGFGKTMNPCVDCKILMMREARQRMDAYGAACVVSGEVVGQRPMSQRRDTLNVIRRESGLGDALLRPLSAKALEPSAAELSGMVDRARLHGISGRGRKEQLQLAKDYGIAVIPTPAGGCRLTEQENGCRYWTVLTRLPKPMADDFRLAHTGRQFWSEGGQGRHWLCVGRNAANNDELSRLAGVYDLRFIMRDFAGPVGLARQLEPWTVESQDDAAALVASFAPHAVRHAQQQGGPVVVLVHSAHGVRETAVLPGRDTPLRWREPRWEEAKEELRTEARAKAQALCPSCAGVSSPAE